MQDIFLAFLRDPSREKFLLLRERLLADPQYQPYSSDLDDLQALYGQEKYEELRGRLKQHLPNLLLSPRLHLLAGLAERKLGNEENANLELAISRQCLAGILSTGDGSQQKPFLVLRTSDIYDVLDHFKKEPRTQALVHLGERSFDVMRCEDESDYWFDISEPFLKMEQSDTLPEDFLVSE